jgi:acyl-CoA thioesterase-1
LRLLFCGAVLAAAGFPPAAAEPITVVALGDSNTAGDGIVAAAAWPATLEKMLRANGHDVRIVNAGVSGDTTAEALARLDQAVPKGTGAAIVFLGRNDKRLHWPVARTEENIDKIVAQLRAQGVEVLLIGFETYDFSEIAKKHGAVYYPDFFDGVTRNGRKLRRYILPFDLVHHLNPSGHTVVAERLFPSVEDLVQAAGG